MQWYPTGVFPLCRNLTLRITGERIGSKLMSALFHVCMQGDYAAARMYYQRALLLSPGSKLLKENLAKLDRLERRLTGGA